MNIDVVYFDNNSQSEIISQSVKTLNDIQSYYKFSIMRDTQSEISRTANIDWGVFRGAQTPLYGKYTIYITEKAFSDNWFSHEEAQYAVLSTNSWEENFNKIPVKLYLIYQIAQAAINFAARLSERVALNMTHPNATGCMFDQCTKKHDIVVGMATGKICDMCRASLQRRMTDDQAIIAVQQMLDYVRISIAQNLQVTI
jgi:hypothetical protein